MPSLSTKKNALFFLIGPPIESAHSFETACGLGVKLALLNQSFAFSFAPFQYHAAFPWNAFVPDLVTKFTCAPACRPYCPVYPLITTAASWISFAPSVRLLAPELFRFR